MPALDDVSAPRGAADGSADEGSEGEQLGTSGVAVRRRPTCTTPPTRAARPCGSTSAIGLDITSNRMPEKSASLVPTNKSKASTAYSGFLCTLVMPGTFPSVGIVLYLGEAEKDADATAFLIIVISTTCTHADRKMDVLTEPSWLT